MLNNEDLLTIKNDLLPYVQRYYWRKIDNIVLRNGAYVATDKVRALDSSGLFLADDSSAYGILIADGGAVTIGDGTAAVNIGSDLTMADTKYIATDKVRARDSDGLLLVDDSDTEGLKVEDGGAVSVTGNWRLKTETEGGTDRLTVTSVGASSAAELFLHPTGAANTSRLTITDAVNTVNYEGIEIEATASANRIGSIAAGTGTVQGLEFQISNSTKMTLTTGGKLGIGISTPDGTAHVHTATAGAVTASTSADDLVVESNGDVGITVLGPDANNKHIYLGETTDNVTAQLSWIGASNLLYVGTHATGGEVQIRSGVGTTAVTIDSSQLVGIGTAPAAPLHVYGYTAGSGTLRLQGTASGNSNISYISFYDSAGTRRGYFGDAAIGNDDIYLVADTGIVSIGTTAGSATTLNVTAGNAVGIGTASPNRTLEVVGQVAVSGASGALDLYQRGGTSLSWGLYSPGTAGELRFYRYLGGGDKITFDASGQVGIGIAPSYLLDVNGTSGFRGEWRYLGTTNTSHFGYSTNEDVYIRAGKDAGKVIIADSAAGMKVGIGETTPLGKLHVKNGDAGAITPSTNADELIIENSSHAGISILSGSTSVGQISFGDTGAASAGYIQYSHNTNVFAFGAGGSTALWLTSADSLYPGTDNSGSCGTSGNRWTDVYAVSGSVNSSDLSEKKDVANLPDIAGLGFVNALRPVRFRWINGERWHFGIIAQELKARLDERGIDAGVFVDPAVNGEPGSLGIRHHELIAPIIKAIQQLDDRLKALEAA